MKRKFLVFVLFISFIGLIECDPPQLNVPDELVLLSSPNDTTELDIKKFELTCSGDNPVQWRTKVRSFYLDYKRVHNDSGFYSTIMFRFPFNSLTGYFNCSYVGEEEKSKSTYIYVHNGYSGFVMYGSEPKTVKVHLGDPMILDCRTSRPDNIKVYLLINQKQVSRLHYQFDPRVGVILEDMKGFPNQTQIKEIICLNNYSVSDKLTFKPEISLRKPFIENRHRSDYLVGEEIALNCSTYMNEKYKPHFEWTLPNINAIRELKEFVNKSLLISTLLIKNASLSDSGQYVCTISVLNLFESNVKNIEVKEYVIQFVKFKNKKDSMVHKKIVNVGDDFLWDMQFEGYPRNLIYTFYNPYGDLFLHKNKRANASYVYEEGKLSLSINRVTEEDFGNYSVILEAPNGSYDENYVMLVVNGTPKAQFSEIPSVLPSYKNFTITLLILAFNLNKPEPDVFCYLESNCSKGLGSCDIAKISSQSYRLEKDIGPPNRFRAVLSLHLSSSGRLYCNVWNGVGFGHAQTYLNVSDQSAPFLVMVRTENTLVKLTSPGTLETIDATEGDNINIACFALDSSYYYVYFNYLGKTNVCDTELSSGRCLNIRNISLRKDWFFECMALTHFKIIEKISFRIDVFEKMAPWVLSSSNVSLEGTEIIVKPPYPFFIACYVKGRPKPKIKWLKDGENIDEIIENNDVVSLRDDNQILDFKFTTKKYEGKYECNVENRVGQIQPFTYVIIEGKENDHRSSKKGLSNRNLSIIIIVSFTIIIIILFSFVIILFIRNKKDNNIRNDMLQLR